MVNVMESLGVEVDVPKKQTCCGQPAFNSGYWPDARSVAIRFLDVFDGDGPIVVPSGSCGAMVRHYYPELFRDDPVQLERSRKLGKRLFEFSEFVVDVLGCSDAKGSNRGAITYHPCCHLLRELGVDEQPATLLRAVNGVEIRPLERADVCCGFGGTFAVKMADISSAMLDEKLDNVESTGAETLIAGDAGVHHAHGRRAPKAWIGDPRRTSCPIPRRVHGERPRVFEHRALTHAHRHQRLPVTRGGHDGRSEAQISTRGRLRRLSQGPHRGRGGYRLMGTAAGSRQGDQGTYHRQSRLLPQPARRER